MNISQIRKFSKKPVVSNQDSFDFELWAQLVKPQLIAALTKRNEEKKKLWKANRNV